jgi:AcrR family transcriptional regulator
MTVPPTPTRLPRAARRAQILGAAAAAFLRAGFDGTSMEDVAREAGVTRLIVYRIFDTKEALYRAVLTDVLDALLTEFAAPDARERIEASGVARLLLDIARTHPDAFRLLWRHAAHEPTFAEIGAVFRRGVTEYATGMLEPVITDVGVRRWAAHSITAYLYEGICAWLDEPDRPGQDDEMVERLARGSRALVDAWTDR